MNALIQVTAAPGRSRRCILPLALSLAALVSLALTQSLRADIFRWDNQTVIPGTEGITPGPGVQLDHRDLAFANLPNLDLTGASFNTTNLSNARLDRSTLTSVDFSGARITATSFDTTTTRAFTAAQLYSTASYLEKNLTSVRFPNNDLTGWNFRGQNVSGASFDRSTMTGVDLTDAQVAGIKDPGPDRRTLMQSITSRGFTKEQLYSTASYRRKDVSFVIFNNNDFTGWDFSGQDLTRTAFAGCTLTGANFTGAIVTGGSFASTTSRGFTKEQLYSTASYRQKVLGSIEFLNNNLTDWDFTGQDLTGAFFNSSILTGIRFIGANLSNSAFFENDLRGVDFSGATVNGARISFTNFTKDQLFSTRSFEQKDLSRLQWTSGDLSGSDLSGFDLSDARLQSVNFTGVNFSGANIEGAHLISVLSTDQLYSTASYERRNLRGVWLYSQVGGWNLRDQDFTGGSFSGALMGTDLTGALISEAFLDDVTSRGFTTAMLYSTASYQQKDLRGIRLRSNDLSGWNLSGQNLIQSNLELATLNNTDLSAADLRAASFFTPAATTQLRNTVRPNGEILGLTLNNSDELVVRDFAMPVSVTQSFVMSGEGTLALQFADASWGSIITFTPSLTPDLGGVLALSFAPSADLAALPGAVFDLFDWPGALGASNRFDRIDTPAGSQWDLSQLYATGEVRLLAIPEPPSFPIIALCALALCVIWLLRRKASVASAVAIALVTLSSPTLLLAESITVEQGNQVTRPTAVTVNAGEEITVRDTASRLDVQNSLTAEGGAIHVNSGGRLNTATIGGQVVLNGGGAQAIVDGAGSFWNTGRGLFRIGQTGEAHLTVSNGGKLESGTYGTVTDIAVPFGPGAPTASTTVTGTGSLWDVRSQLRMGRGEFSILDGGAVNVLNSAEFGVAMTRGPIKVVVSGPGSTWDVRGEINIVDTPHEIIVEGGATIRSGIIGGRVHFTGPLAGPRGSATIRGAQTRWEMGGFSPIRTDVLVSDGASLIATYAALDRTTMSIRDGAVVSIGDFMTVDSGTIRVESGATLTTNNRSGDTRLATGGARAFVDGPGSTWTVGGSFEIGDLGEGHLAISNGAVVHSGMGGNRTRVSGGTLPGTSPAATATVEGTGSKWIVDSGLEIGDSGESHLVIRNGGYVTSGKNGNRTRIAGAAQPVEPPSTAVVSGSGSAWDVLGDFSVATNGNGSLSILDGGRVTSGTGGFTQLSGSANRPGFATIDGANSIWMIQSSFRMGNGAPVFVRVANDGVLSVQTTLTGEPQSVLELAGGRVEATQFTTSGEIRGTGTIVADVTSRNKTAVGNSAGLLTINGDFIQTAAASLALELGGRGGVAGVDFDQLVVRDLASFQGPIDVTLLNNFTPDKDDSFELIHYGSLQYGTPGVPPPLNLPPLTGDLFWSSNFGPQALTITVVPEPSGFVLTAVCALALCIIWRSKRKASVAPVIVGLLAVLWPANLLAESIIVEQGNQVVRTGDIRVNAAEQIEVRDPGSKLDIQDYLTVEGGTIRVDSSAILNTNNRSGHSRLTAGGVRAFVDGPGSVWSVGGYLEVGDVGEAHLTISNGGKVVSGLPRNRTRIGFGQPLTPEATAIVTGPNSSWNIGSELAIGRGTLSVLNGATVTVGDTFSIDTGTLNVRDGSSVTIGRGFSVGPGKFFVMDGGQVTHNHFARLAGFYRTGPAQAIVSGAGSTWTIKSNLEVGDSGQAHLTIRDGGKVISGIDGERTRIVGAGHEIGEPPSSVTVSGAGSSWEVLGEFSVATDGNASLSVLNGGRVTSGTGGRTVLGGSASRSGFATVDGANSIWTVEGAFEMGVGDVPATLRVANGGLLSVQTTFFGGTRSVLELAGGSVEAAEMVMNGEIRGGGTIVADLTSQSRLAVGNSAGQLSIGGDFTQLSGASLAMELGGRGGVAGLDFDQLVVRDAATLQGPINVTLLNNFAPARGDSFELIRYSSLEFGTPGVPPPLNLPSLSGDLSWSSNFGPQALTITVVPEPATYALAAIALVGLSFALRCVRRMLTTMNRTTMVALALASILSLTTAAARASLTFDLRAVSGSQIIIHGPKSVAVNRSSVGGWIDFELWATVTGSNLQMNDDGLQHATGLMLSTHRGLGAVGGSMVNSGELAPRVLRGVVPPFDGLYSSSGSLTNLDDDPDLEIGSPNLTSLVGDINARPGLYPVYDLDGGELAEFLVFRFTLPIESVMATSLEHMTEIAFMHHPWVVGHLWFEDGRPFNGARGTIRASSGVLIHTADTPEELAMIPEPATWLLALLGIAGALWFAKRRRS